MKISDFIDYFGLQQLGLNQKTVSGVTQEIKQILPAWKIVIVKSFLPKIMQEKYLKLLEERWQRLQS